MLLPCSTLFGGARLRLYSLCSKACARQPPTALTASDDACGVCFSFIWQQCPGPATCLSTRSSGPLTPPDNAGPFMLPRQLCCCLFGCFGGPQHIESTVSTPPQARSALDGACPGLRCPAAARHAPRQLLPGGTQKPGMPGLALVASAAAIHLSCACGHPERIVRCLALPSTTWEFKAIRGPWLGCLSHAQSGVPQQPSSQRWAGAKLLAFIWLPQAEHPCWQTHPRSMLYCRYITDPLPIFAACTTRHLTL